MREEMKKVKVNTCPQCGSHKVFYEAGLVTGYKYHCKRCNYIGAFIIEKEIETEELE
jgi:DNA-directed RNA polymerase subunit RPC12/RpoP